MFKLINDASFARLVKQIQVVESRRPVESHECFLPSASIWVGKNWDFTAALSDFEQLRQVHAGNLTYSFPEDRIYQPSEKEMARVGRPVLHRQDEVVQGEAQRFANICLFFIRVQSLFMWSLDCD